MVRLRSTDYAGSDFYGTTAPDGGRPEWLSVPIAPAECVLRGPDGHNYVRQQLPLELAQAITVHSAQGTTADHVALVVTPHAGDFAFAEQRFYSAATRARSMHGLHILAPHPYSTEYWTRLFTQHRAHVLRVLAELDRLRALPGWTPEAQSSETLPPEMEF